MIDWNKRNGGFLDDFHVREFQVSNLSQQIDKLKQELQRKDNIINKLEKWLKSEQKRYRNYLLTRATNDTEYSSQYATQCGLVQLDVVLNKLKELRGKDK